LIVVDESPTAALLEAELLVESEATWLERNEIGRILAEQELQATFGAADGRNRITLGEVLKADVLVMLRNGKREKEPYAELVVAETTGGLRLLARSVPLSGDDENDAASLAKLVHEALVKHGQGIREVYAVPPFLSQDLSHQYDYLQTAYARLVEQSLMRQPGAMVVELAEAEAVSREFMLAAPDEKPVRQLPLYLIGEYRHDGLGDELRVSVTLRAKRGASKIGETKKTLLPDEAPNTLLDIASGLVSDSSQAWGAVDADAEAQQLADRARSFLNLGFWDQAASLFESSLLLKPDQPEVRSSLVEVAMQTSRRLTRIRSKKSKDYVALIACWQRMFEHLERLTMKGDFDCSRLVRMVFSDSSSRDIQQIRDIANVPATLMRTAEQNRRREIQLACRLSHVYAECEDWLTCRQCLAYAKRYVAPKEYYDHLFEWIMRHQDRLDTQSRVILLRSTASIEYRRFCQRLLETPKLDSAIAKGARNVLAEANLNAPLTPTNSDQSVARPGNENTERELTFRPIDLHYTYKGTRRRVNTASGCLALGNGDDVFWGVPLPYLLKVTKTGQDAEFLWAPERTSGPMPPPSYDGTHLWFVHGEQVHVVDPTTGQSWSIANEQGLPEGASVIVPLGNRSAIAAGGRDRAWLARLTVSLEGNHRVHVFHEAKETGAAAVMHDSSTNQQSPEYENAWRNPRMACKAKFGVLRESENGDESVRRVFIGRYHSHNTPVRLHPWIIDPDSLDVEVMQDEWPARPEEIWHDRDRYSLQLDPENKEMCRIVREGIAGVEAADVCTGIAEGRLEFLDASFHVIGKSWLRVDPADGRHQSLGRVPWVFNKRMGPAGTFRRPQIGDWELLAVGRSNHFGFFVSCRQYRGSTVLAEVAFDGTGVSLQDILHGKGKPRPTAVVAPASPVPRRRTTRSENLWKSNVRRWYLDLAYSPDGRLIVTTSRHLFGSPFTVQAWDGRDGSLVADLLKEGNDVTETTFSPSGKYFATGDKKGQLIIWKADTLEPVRRWQAHERETEHLAFSWNDDWLASAAGDRRVQVWSVPTVEKKFENENRIGFLDWVGFTPDDQRLITSKPGAYWDLASGKPVGNVDTIHAPLGFTRDRRLLATAKEVEQGLILWDCRDDSCRRLWPRTPGRVVAAAADGTRVATLAKQVDANGRFTAFGSLTVWDTESQRPIARTNTAPRSQDWTFSPDGSELLAVRGYCTPWRWRYEQPVDHPTPRTWSDHTGQRTSEAIYLGVTDRGVRVRKLDGREVVVPLDGLSRADQLFVHYQTHAASLPDAKPDELIEDFGQWIDPTGDCTFARESYKLKVTVPAGDYDLNVDKGNMRAPRVLHEVEGDFVLDIMLAGEFAVSDDLKNEATAYRGAGLLVMLDDDNYLRLEYGVIVPQGDRPPAFIFSYRVFQGGRLTPSMAMTMFLDKAMRGTHLAIERHGDEFALVVNAGKFGLHPFAPLHLPFPKKVLVGFAAVNTSSTPFHPEFGNLRLQRPLTQMEMD